MARKLMLIVVLLAAFGQAVAVTFFPRAEAGELGHMLEHAEERAHHHHDDGGLHVDLSGDSSFHVHLDGANPLGLPASSSPQTVPSQPHSPPAISFAPLPSPMLDGLLRPPKLSS